MKHIDEFTIHSFRGIRDLRLEKLGQINLLVGENNSGKTSVLEALSVFSDLFNWRSWYNAASARETNSRLSQSERLVWLFPREGDTKDSEIFFSGNGSFALKKVSAHYEEFTEMVRYPGSRKQPEGIEEGAETEFEGIRINVSVSDSKETVRNSLAFSEARPFPASKRQEAPVLPMQIVNPFSHRLSTFPVRLWSDVVDAEMKADVIELLQFFDSGIEDIDIVVPTEIRPMVTVKHERLGRAPLSTFGDGLRRVFALASAIAGSANGLLLIDELEIAIHTRALEKTFDWLIKSCVQNNIQLFATTHSLETVDAILKVSGDTVDLVAYRLEEGENQTAVTRFDVSLLKRLREVLGLEIR